MRVYEKNELKKIICDRCGHYIDVTNEIAKEDYFSANKNWGYFSKKDGMSHSFELCEKCYDIITNVFCIPIEETQMTELI